MIIWRGGNPFFSGDHSQEERSRVTRMEVAFPWDSWVDEGLRILARGKLLRSTRPIHVSSIPTSWEVYEDGIETFEGPHPWDRSSVEVEVEGKDFRSWMNEDEDGAITPPSVAVIDNDFGGKLGSSGKKLLLFSGNDYLGLSSHPSVRKAAAETAQTCGMGPRGSALVCGYTNYHKMLEASFAKLKKKEDCLLCPTGFAANMAFMTTLGDLSVLSSNSKSPGEGKDTRIAIFSDAFNHASIIDGIRVIQRLPEVNVFVYNHCDTVHLDALLSSCKIEKKVVITDSLFSMDGDFAPMLNLVQLRKKHKFLLAIDDAHGTFVCGENGGGVAELHGCEGEVDLCIGTLSKAAGCSGGFIACSTSWKRLLQSRGRSFIFSSSLPVPIVAAAHASLVVSRKERWRRSAIWTHVQDFSRLSELPVTSPIVSVILGSEESAIHASRYMLEKGFHVVAIRPPSVPPNSCRLRLTLSAAHSTEDIQRLAGALIHCLNLTKQRNLGCTFSKM